MKIVTADHLYIDGEYRKNHAVVFDEKIIDTGPYEEILGRYPDVEVEEKVEHSVLYPGFINTHVHLEFSENRTTLRYGDFLPWLYSVIEEGDQLAERCTTGVMLEACRSMLQSGVTTFGAISSMGLDLDACIETPQRVVYFNELIGSHPERAEAAYDAFVERYKKSRGYEEARVTPAIAVHSPYSVRPEILKKAVSLAKADQVPLTAHFLESEAERQWLDHSEGAFRTFFETFFNQSEALTSIEAFLEHFDGYPTHFAHAVHAGSRELARLAREGHSIAHCPRSNRYLGCGRLQIERLDALDIPYTLATDGLSSNDSLNLFDEWRAALMMHTELELNALAKRLIRSVTSDAARILHRHAGRIRKGYDADLALIELPEAPGQEEEIALWTILHTRRVSQVYIAGERYL